MSGALWQSSPTRPPADPLWESFFLEKMSSLHRKVRRARAPDPPSIHVNLPAGGFPNTTNIVAWTAGGALARVWGCFSTWAAPEHYKYSGLADFAVLTSFKRQLNEPKHRVYGHHENAIKQPQNRYPAASAPPRWTLAGAILNSAGAFPAPRRLPQSVRNDYKTRIKRACATSGRRLTNHERRQAQNR